MDATDGRPRLLVLNQYYWPGVEATAHLLTQLCEMLAVEYEVTVVTGALHGHPDLPREEWRHGVRILRTRSTAYERSRLKHRAANYATYLADSIFTALRGDRPHLVLTMTDPPVAGDIGLLVARRFGASLLVISQDVFPEIAVELKRLENPFVIAGLRALVATYLRRSDAVVAIGETMRERLKAKGAAPDRIAVIPNWVDTESVTPQPLVNDWSEAKRLAGRFVVMHSGNVGHAQDLDTLVRAATFLRDLDNLRVPIIGFGARHAEIGALVDRLEVDAVSFLPYQPRDVLPLSLSSAHLHYVGLARGLAGYIVPSRVYGILAAGRPVLVAADEASETVRLVREAECGIVVPPGRPDRVAEVIRCAHDGELDLEGMGARGRAWVEREGDRSLAFERYRDLVGDLVSSSSR